MSTQNAHISTLTNGSLGTQIFWSILTIVGAYYAFFYDWSRVRIQSPIAFVVEEQTALAAASGETAPVEGGKRAEIRSDTIRTAAAFDLSAIAKAENIKLSEEDMSLDKKRQAYIRKYGPTAIAEMKKYGIPASITIAQGLLESRAGTSKLATENNNHFGMKCFSRRCTKGHCSNFTDDTHKDFFLKYNSSWESFRAHSKLLTSGRYKELQRYGLDYVEWAKGLKKLGYATAAEYDVSLIRLIRLYGLHRLDKK